jgi:hypothetical protein
MVTVAEVADSDCMKGSDDKDCGSWFGSWTVAGTHSTAGDGAAGLEGFHDEMDLVEGNILFNILYLGNS